MKKLLGILVAMGAFLVVIAFFVNRGGAHGKQDTLFEKRGVERGLLVDTVSATGQVAPRQVSVVVSAVGGQVVKIFDVADSNRFVQADEPLLLLDPSYARVKFEQAKAAVIAARTDVGRAKAQRDAARIAVALQRDLFDQKVGQKAKVEETQYLLNAAEAAVEAAGAKVKMAESARDEAQLGLDRTIIRAPVAGVILERKVFLGQMVGPQLPEPLFKIASDLSQMDVHAQVAEGDISKVTSEQEATFTVYAHAESNVRFEGLVKRVDNLPRNIQGAVYYNTVIRVTNRHEPPTRETWIRICGVLSTTPLVPTAGLPWAVLRQENPWMLRPGMTATVDIIRRQHANVWKLPIEALGLQLDEPYQTAAARQKLREWRGRRDADDWKHVWIQDAARNDNRPWPIFVRIGGLRDDGQPGIKDSQFIEVLEWDADMKGKLNPASPATFPQIIISAPPATKPGLFDLNKPARIMS